MLLDPQDPRATPGRRLQVVGTSGCGKTTLARTLARRLNLPHIELDAIHWQPSWTPRPKDDFRTTVSAALSIPAFVVDGNYSHISDTIRPHIDTILWLDYTFPLVMRQVAVRTLRRAITRQQLWNGNRESLRLQFSKDSILLWVIQTHARRLREFSARFTSTDYDPVTTIRFKSPTQVRRWLQANIPNCHRLTPLRQ